MKGGKQSLAGQPELRTKDFGSLSVFELLANKQKSCWGASSKFESLASSQLDDQTIPLCNLVKLQSS